MRMQFAIGERAELIITAGGNILWDLIPFLDQETVDKVCIKTSEIRPHMI